MPVEKDDPLAAESQGESAPIRLAFVGKPNVGKSSLVNRLLGRRGCWCMTSPAPPATHRHTLHLAGARVVLVDTAGLRRRRAIDTLTEAVSAKMARDQLARADVVALVIDAQNGATAEDAKLASFIEESGRAALIVVNKGDLIRRAEIDGKVAAVREELASWRGRRWWSPLRSRDVALVKSRR